MDSDLVILDYDDNDNDSYDYNNNEYKKCDKCSITLFGNNSGESHCCQCGHRWNNKNQVYCNKCYKDGLIYFNPKNINITPILSKYNGQCIVYNIYGKIIFSGELKKGKYHGSGTLFFSDNNRYQGDFREGKHHGFGVLFEEKSIIIGLYEASKIINKLKVFDPKELLHKDVCNLCGDESDVVDLFTICGSKNCSFCCLRCIKTFFENKKCNRGARLFKNMILCPFCRQHISNDVMKIYHPALHGYISEIEKIKGPKEIIGLCSECCKNDLRELNEECGEQASREKYICDECVQLKSLDNVKKCPNCGIKVYRIDGCHWMACKCNKAWCWYCLKVMEIKEGHVVNCKYCGK